MEKRHPEALVAPTVTFLAVVALLCFARFYDRSPIQAPDCGFRSTFNIPCISCGGTRAFQALSNGHFTTAVSYNPAVILGVIAILVWLIGSLVRFGKGGPPANDSRRRPNAKTLALVITLILTLNWIYLILYLPR